DPTVGAPPRHRACRPHGRLLRFGEEQIAVLERSAEHGSGCPWDVTLAPSRGRAARVSLRPTNPREPRRGVGADRGSRWPGALAAQAGGQFSLHPPYSAQDSRLDLLLVRRPRAVRVATLGHGSGMKSGIPGLPLSTVTSRFAELQAHDLGKTRETLDARRT